MRRRSAVGSGGCPLDGVGQLRSLALAEIRFGEPGRALEHLSHALKKLEGVPLLNARRVEPNAWTRWGMPMRREATGVWRSKPGAMR